MKEYEQKICNIIDNLKAEMRYQCDKVNEQAYKQGHKRGYDEGYEIGKQDGYKDGQETLVNAYEMKDILEDAKKAEYIRGLNDAWEMVRKIIEPVYDGGYSFDVLHQIFGESAIRSILKHNTAPEAIAKIKEYEDKQDAEIKVGDEVNWQGIKSVVVRISHDYIYTLTESGGTQIYHHTDTEFIKTGRTFPQVAEVMKEMRGAENDE